MNNNTQNTNNTTGQEPDLKRIGVISTSNVQPVASQGAPAESQDDPNASTVVNSSTINTLPHVPRRFHGAANKGKVNPRIEKFLWIPRELARFPKLEWTEKVLLAKAHNFSQRGGIGLIRTNAQLANDLGITPTSVERMIRRLVRRNYLRRGPSRILRAQVIQSSPCKSRGIQIRQPFLDDPTLSWMERALLGLISGLAINKGYCFASNEHLADELGFKPRYVRRLINRLQEHGYLVALPTPKGRHLVPAFPSPTSYPGGPSPLPSGVAKTIPQTPGTALLGPHIRKSNNTEEKNEKGSAASGGPSLSLSNSHNVIPQSSVRKGSAIVDPKGCSDGSSIISYLEVPGSSSDIRDQSVNRHPPDWNPIKDTTWQKSQIKHLIEKTWDSMQQAGLIPKTCSLKNLDILVNEIEEILGSKMMRYELGSLMFSEAVDEIILLLELSWYGMSQPIDKDDPKNNPWACCRGANNLKGFFRRYDKLKGLLDSQWKVLKEIHAKTRDVYTELLQYYRSHRWGYQWRTSGDTLVEDPPVNILDEKKVSEEKTSLETIQKVYAQRLRQNSTETPREILESMKRNGCDALFWWATLRQCNDFKEAANYEEAARSVARKNPEKRHVFGEAFPDVFKKFKAEQRQKQWKKRR